MLGAYKCSDRICRIDMRKVPEGRMDGLQQDRQPAWWRTHSFCSRPDILPCEDILPVEIFIFFKICLSIGILPYPIFHHDHKFIHPGHFPATSMRLRLLGTAQQVIYVYCMSGLFFVLANMCIQQYLDLIGGHNQSCKQRPHTGCTFNG